MKIEINPDKNNLLLSALKSGWGINEFEEKQI